METWLNKIEENRSKIDEICTLIENDYEYMEEVKRYLPRLNQLITELFAVAEKQSIVLNKGFVCQVLTDFLDGIEHVDEVLLLDTLRYGMREIMTYMIEELEGGQKDEHSCL